MDFARELGLDPNIVEKDYVLGWLLAGIANHPSLQSEWIFKGGTCLKKCYFETYRFSEDLDFTLTNKEHLTKEFVIKAFSEIAQSVYNDSGIEIPTDKLRFDVFNNNRGGLSAEGRVSYRGPMQRGGDLPRLKLDLTTDEVITLDPVEREIHHPYSDKPERGFTITCYCFEEVFAEKIRALAERERPRDLYDVIHLFRHDALLINRALILETLQKKCAFKGIAVPTMANLENKSERLELEVEWKNMLAHQLPMLPPFEQFWHELPQLFQWLFTTVPVKVNPPMPVTGDFDKTWQPPKMVQAWYTQVPLEIIRFAGANRLCVNLGYQGSYRLIEPYSLRRTKDGDILLYAVKHQSGEIRAYRIDRITGAQATDIAFVPRYTIELTPSGSISVSSTTRRSNHFNFQESKTRGRGFGPRYVVQCSYCNKKFNRKKYDARLNPHKDKNGYPCPNRNGTLIQTTY
jgi:predicted nucleotidyltransferase component of viral defense system